MEETVVAVNPPRLTMHGRLRLKHNQYCSSRGSRCGEVAAGTAFPADRGTATPNSSKLSAAVSTSFAPSQSKACGTLAVSPKISISMPDRMQDCLHALPRHQESVTMTAVSASRYRFDSRVRLGWPPSEPCHKNQSQKHESNGAPGYPCLPRPQVAAQSVTR